MNNYCVYLHKCPNGKVYIGITGKKPYRRWRYGFGYQANKHFYNAIKKYGWKNIKHIILFKDLTKEEAEKREMELITEYKSNQRKYGYNFSSGGEMSALGHKVSKKHKEILRKANLGKKMSKETKEKIAKSKYQHLVLCVETGEIYYGTGDAARKNCLNANHINEACKGILKTTGKKHWRFVEKLKSDIM